MTEYDYIVVGAGTAGCMLAARFSPNPAARVLVLHMPLAGRKRPAPSAGAGQIRADPP